MSYWISLQLLYRNRQHYRVPKDSLTIEVAFEAHIPNDIRSNWNYDTTTNYKLQMACSPAKTEVVVYSNRQLIFTHRTSTLSERNLCAVFRIVTPKTVLKRWLNYCPIWSAVRSIDFRFPKCDSSMPNISETFRRHPWGSNSTRWFVSNVLVPALWYNRHTLRYIISCFRNENINGTFIRWWNWNWPARTYTCFQLHRVRPGCAPVHASWYRFE